MLHTLATINISSLPIHFMEKIRQLGITLVKQNYICQKLISSLMSIIKYFQNPSCILQISLKHIFQNTTTLFEVKWLQQTWITSHTNSYLYWIKRFPGKLKKNLGKNLNDSWYLLPSITLFFSRGRNIKNKQIWNEII